MPIYTYRSQIVEKGCAYCREEFETLQKIREEALKVCPECGVPVVRIMHGATAMQDKSTKTILSDDNLRKHGFKKLVKGNRGTYDEVV
jgi:putative FmdB family regulatory protein